MSKETDCHLWDQIYAGIDGNGWPIPRQPKPEVKAVYLSTQGLANPAIRIRIEGGSDLIAPEDLRRAESTD